MIVLATVREVLMAIILLFGVSSEATLTRSTAGGGASVTRDLAPLTDNETAPHLPTLSLLASGTLRAIHLINMPSVLPFLPRSVGGRATSVRIKDRFGDMVPHLIGSQESLRKFFLTLADARNVNANCM